MTETISETTELTSQYSAQVTDDLDRNLKEQGRINGEIEVLQAQLTSLQRDQNVLMSIQHALEVPTAPATSTVEPDGAVPAPRKKAADDATQPTGTKTGAAARKRTTKESALQAPTAPARSSTLVNLVREYLAGQSEPRSAGEITTALGQQHPERTVKTTVVRTTLEGLVAKSQAQRSKQGSSVFYTTPDPVASATSGGEGPGPQQSE
ncbi:hypothetical protein [Streptomyces chartreusis]|uniref:Uncharacterized protein n=1 Tax=Streptomyces chartreusis TaxID=1969 RepID=A0A7I0Y8W0_STRCX|nr:hypothetical protein [Streptomyces chartreusis]QKZ15941.1 hypothetical protein HUT05_00030 [Streptomyces chartreusis]